MLAKRAIVLVIDACGIGSLDDWQEYDEIAPSNTLYSVCKKSLELGKKLNIPNLCKLGLSNIIELPGLAYDNNPIASWGKMAELNPAKDTITGHWEMMGIKALKAFPYYPNGFPEYLINEFKKRTGVTNILGNKAASGTEIINEYGDLHKTNLAPIIYTSADSVLQIAANIEVIDLAVLYQWCKIAREIMQGKDEVARIIARPFMSNPNYREGSSKASELKYIRCGDKRHDYSVLPHSKSALDILVDNGDLVTGFGKISDIFAKQGISSNIDTKNNLDALNKIIKHLERPSNKNELLFINLVETDSNYGHRRDPEGFGKALEEIDRELPKILDLMSEQDILMISADHGCDPCAAGTDHTREYVPILFYNSQNQAQSLGLRESFADIGATILDWFNLPNNLSIKGQSLFQRI